MAQDLSDLSRRPPPLILAIENAGLCGSVALLSGSHCIAEQSLWSTLTHSKRLLATVERVMGESRTSWEELDAIAVSLGPGSFTGLRIGLSTVKGLSLATAIPLIGVPTLDGLAAQLCFSALPVCPIIDARKQEVYTALYKVNGQGSLERQGEYLVVSPLTLAGLITEPTLFCGDGIAAHGAVLRERLGPLAVFAPEQLYYARAASIGWLALAHWQNQEFLDPSACVPLYVRASDAELNFRSRNS